MEVKAQLNNLRMAPRKVRAVSNLIKNKDVTDALNQLEVMVKRSSLSVAKLLKSAIANAENTHNMIKENLYVKSIKVDEGVKLKRFRPKGFGRVSPIEKKTSHISLVLAEKIPGLKRKIEKPEKKQDQKTTDNSDAIVDTIREKRPAGGEARPSRRDDESRLSQGRPEIKTELGRKEGVFSGIGKRIFRRKSI